ncbi:hypothetical protein D3C78_1713210 [compost metagenome]
MSARDALSLLVVVDSLCLTSDEKGILIDGNSLKQSLSLDDQIGQCLLLPLLLIVGKAQFAGCKSL